MGSKIRVEAEIMDTVNFAMQQNYVPFIRKICVYNDSQEILRNLIVKVKFEPAFASSYLHELVMVNVGACAEISPVELVLSTEFLHSLTEKMVGRVTVEVLSGEEKLGEYERSVEILACDQWCGYNVMPELLSAYVTPNHPVVKEILEQAARLMEKWGYSPSLSGYREENPQLVKMQMKAIYTVLQSKEIIYNRILPQYEPRGQRLRLAPDVIQYKQGNCIDMSLLYAACLEAAHLHPLLVIMEGHCFTGGWLKKMSFADSVVEDVSVLEEQFSSQEKNLLLLEATLFRAGTKTDFEGAVKQGGDNLSSFKFVMAVDVIKARENGVRPIPLLLETVNYSYEDASSATDTGSVKIPEPMAEPPKQEEPLTKQKVWERKLLDFSMRNSLLNFRPGKNSLQFEGHDLKALETAFESGGSLQELLMPEEWTVKDVSQSELEKTLKGIYHRAKTSLEENGANTLFLALGFLRWFEPEVLDKPRYAPLILLPVEVVKGTSHQGYVINSRREDAQMNITLLEYLKQAFGIQISGLDPLPMKEDGVDVDLVLHAVRQAIKDKKNWSVEETAFLGIFSFAQFVMWNDIRNRSEELMKSKVVSGLMAGRMTWIPEAQKVTLENLDEVLEPDQAAVPLSADSSQLVAIAAAASGKSFVLHGPPGTGKSQTITNMIANAMYHGKTVLFVAEKMAALNVVQNRLAKLGLAPFCLELHSNKTGKAEVLTQLNRTLEMTRKASPEDYKEKADRLLQMRKELNGVLHGLHDRRSFGCSLYQAIEQVEMYKDKKGIISFEPEFVDALTASHLNELRELLREFVVAASEVGVYKENPWYGYQGTEYSLELRDAIQKAAGDLVSRCREAREVLGELGTFAGVGEICDKKSFQEVLTLKKLGTLPGNILKELLLSPAYHTLYTQLLAVYQVGATFRESEEALRKAFEPAIYEYDAAEALAHLKEAGNSWGLLRKNVTNKILKELQYYAIVPETITANNMKSYLNKLSMRKSLQGKFDKISPELTGFFGDMYRGVNSDFAAMGKALAKTDKIHSFLAHVAKARQTSYVQSIENLSFNSELEEKAKYFKEFLQVLGEWKERFHIDISIAEEQEDWIGSLATQAQGYANHLSKLHAWVTMNRKATSLRENGLGAIVDAWESAVIASEEAEAVFECNLHYALVLRIVGEEENLKEFRGKQYEDVIRKYSEMMEEFRELTAQELVATLSARIPAAGTVSAADEEVGLLKKAIKSNGRMVSLRALFERIPNLLRKTSPCMLMSPIAVAQYLDPSMPKFDLVIFDEASQLPTCEAVGAIARGNNVVVVGDPKQLPPTSFFSSQHSDTTNWELEDLESLLDDCLSISMPQEHLKWHYRSRHESLIAYSNMKYYDNNMYTFPSPDDLVSEVTLVPVEGYYDMGKTKQNRAEAQAVVEEIIRRLRDEELRKDSIGVVTFSLVQQMLIDDLLAAEFVKYPELAEYDRSSKEPVFVKNLENVQGDERDIILFSVGYGPDAQGRVSMNFGPLNRDGGWRRLNVAISRSRKKMIVYSTLRPEQIDLSRTRAEGVAGLRGFLEFAVRGKSALATREGTPIRKTDSMVLRLADEIRKMGYRVMTNIGCSAYKVDIGVVDENNPSSYRLGILLDGENCKEAATSGDRFVLQPSILKGLGWKLMRVWTLEWLDRPASVLESIRQELESF